MPFRRRGSGSWYIRVKGLRRSAETEVYADAKALEDKLNHEHWLEQKMGVKPKKSWKEACVRWVREKQHKVDIGNDEAKISWLDQHLGHVTDVNSIGRALVDAIMQQRGVRSSNPDPRNTTANRYVALIGGILNAAEKEWEWGTRAPVLKRYPEPESNGRCLTLEEWNKLQTQLPEHLGWAATFSLSTGLREEKVFSLLWTQLGTEMNTLTFSGTGNKLGNTIPLNQTAQDVLRAIRCRPVVHSTNVFTYPREVKIDGRKTMVIRPMKEHGQASFKKAVKRAEIGHVRWKDFRTTFNSWLAQRGVPREIRCRLMGHTTKEVQDRYTRLYVDHLRPFSEIIDSVLAQQTGLQIAK